MTFYIFIQILFLNSCAYIHLKFISAGALACTYMELIRQSTLQKITISSFSKCYLSVSGVKFLLYINL